MNRISRIGVLFGALALMAFTSVATVLYNTAKIGPYFTSTHAFDSTSIGQIGGQVEYFLAGDSVQVGNVAYLSAANTVKRDTVLVHYNSVVGIVVGGTRTGMQTSIDSTYLGTLAATAGQRVVVLRRGRTWVQLDTGAGFSPGVQILPSIKAGSRGRVMARTTQIDTLNRIFGKMLDSGVSGGKRMATISVR